MPSDIRDHILATLPRLRRFARGITGNVDEADDLVQAACERALSRSSQWQPGTRLDSWMFRIVQTIHLDRVRSHRRRETILQDVRLGSAEAMDGEAAAHSRHTLTMVRRIVDLLPAEQRVVIMLVCVEGHSYREAADILCVPIGTVTSRLTRGRMAIVRALEAGRTEAADHGVQIAAVRASGG